jgi:glutaredoxin 3
VAALRRIKVVGLFAPHRKEEDTMPAHVRIYLTQGCPFCHSAKRLLSQKGADFEEQDVGSDNDTRAWLEEATGQRTVPQIFINHEPVGGYSDLKTLDARGELDKLLAADPIARVAAISS